MIGAQLIPAVISRREGLFPAREICHTVPYGTGFSGWEWREGKGLDLGCGPRACPAGATELSPGFQPWEPLKINGSP